MLLKLKALMGWGTGGSRAPRRLFNNPSFLNQRCCINGQLVTTASNAQFPVASPASGKIIGFVSACGIAEVKKAIEAAQLAAPAWKKSSLEKRLFFVSRWANKIKENQNDLATLLTIQQGKCIAESKMEVEYTYRMLTCLHDLATKKEVLGDYANCAKEDLAILEQTNAVFTAIVPDDFPIARLAKIVSLVLLSGNTLVLRAEKNTAFTSLTMASLALGCDLPPGILNVFTGEHDVINPILEKEQSLTKITTPLSKQLPFLSTELSSYPRAAKAACCIVFDDVNLDLASSQSVALSYFNNGQYSLGISQLFIHKSIYDAFCKKFFKITTKQKIGDPLDLTVQRGPLAHPDVLQLTRQLVANLARQNATIACGGEYLGGLFYTPTVITDPNGELDLSSEKMIGPVTVLSQFETEEDVIQRIKRNPCQRIVYLLTEDKQKLALMTEMLKEKIVVIPDDASMDELFMEFI